MDEKKLHWPWLLKVLLALGGVLVVIGLALAVGQVFGIGWFIVGRGDVFAALQVHLGLAAIGGAAGAISLAARAYELQRRELKVAEDQIEELRQVPYVVVGWVGNDNVTVNGDLATVTVRANAGPRHMPLMFSLSNTRRRLASIYEVAIELPDVLEPTIAQIVNIEAIKADYGKLVTRRLELPGRVRYSWLFVQDPRHILLPNGFPLCNELLQVDVKRACEATEIRDCDHNLTVTINGDWSPPQPPQTLKLKLELDNTQPKETS